MSWVLTCWVLLGGCKTFGEPQAAEVLVLEVNLYYKEKIDKFLPVKVRLIA